MKKKELLGQLAALKQKRSTENARLVKMAAEGQTVPQVELTACLALDGEITALEATIAATPDDVTAPSAEQLAQLQTQAKREGAAAEQQRQADIRKAGAALSLDAAFVDVHLSGTTSVEEFRRIAIDKAAEVADKTPTRSHTTLQMGADARDKRVQLISGALLHKFQPSVYKLEPEARAFSNMRLIRLAEECLSLGGLSVRGMSEMEIATRALSFNGQATIMGAPTMEQFAAMSTSDFPYILADVANKTLRRAYSQEPQTWRPFCNQSSATDFKAKYVNQLGDAPSLELVAEGGEFKYGSIPEARESYALKTYGKILPLTRQAIINDDLSAFTRIPQLQGRAVARLENDLVWTQITSNPTMGDGDALFHANHANLVGSGTVINIDNIGIMRTLLRVQTGLGGTETLNLIPKFLLAPAALEQVALQYTLNGYVASTASTQNVWANLLTPIVEPRLDAADANAWYLVADPNQVDTLEYAYLSGQEGAFYETRLGFNVDGLELKVRHDFGSKVIDWRAFAKNVGA